MEKSSAEQLKVIELIEKPLNWVLDESVGGQWSRRSGDRIADTKETGFEQRTPSRIRSLSRVFMATRTTQIPETAHGRNGSRVPAASSRII